MKTVVKYIVLKSKEYQLGHVIHENELDASRHYFDDIPPIFEYQGRIFSVFSKELTRKKIYDDTSESQTIVVKVLA